MLIVHIYVVLHVGAIGGELLVEGHGGYTYCGVASLILLNRADLCDFNRLLRWAVYKQMSIEGGFNGRTNKLVDGCYSYWVGSLFNLISIGAQQQGKMELSSKVLSCMNTIALEKYIIICCNTTSGGLRDKPGKLPDYYHTCYCLSGLSVAQHNAQYNQTKSIAHNPLDPTNVLYNVTVDATEQGLQYYCGLTTQ